MSVGTEPPMHVGIEKFAHRFGANHAWGLRTTHTRASNHPHVGVLNNLHAGMETPTRRGSEQPVCKRGTRLHPLLQVHAQDACLRSSLQMCTLNVLFHSIFTAQIMKHTIFLAQISRCALCTFF